MASFIVKACHLWSKFESLAGLAHFQKCLVFTVEFPTETTLQMLQRISGLSDRMRFSSLHALPYFFCFCKWREKTAHQKKIQSFYPSFMYSMMYSRKVRDIGKDSEESWIIDFGKKTFFISRKRVVPVCSVCPPRQNWPPPNPSTASQCVPPPPEPRGGGHTRLQVRGWGKLNSNDWRKA